MNIETLKVPVSDLGKGMLVVKLDRPWLETPFKLQGFRIEHQRELDMLAKYCKHVYIDVDRGVAPPAGRGERVTLTEEGEVVQPASLGTSGLIGGDPARQKTSAAATQVTLPPPAVEYVLETTFAEELPSARAAVDGTKRALRDFMQNLDHDARNWLGGVREAAYALEASVLRNPDPAMLFRAVASEEPFSFRHGVHSAVLGIALARELGFRKQAIHELTMGILLQDMGKMRLPKELLRATRRLDEREAEIMRLHVKFSVQMAEALDSLTPGTLAVIASHHERFNGSGYPGGLRGGQIPLAARIAGLVDSFDALTSERTYSEPIPVYEAVQELYAATVDVFQRDLVERLIQVLGTHPIGSLVELSDGCVAIVVALNRHRRLLPCVVRLTDAAKRPVARAGVDDLSAAEKAVVTVREIIDPGTHGVAQPRLGDLFD
ncbi:MAG: HD-GYP domain-containing protein [Gammaproteobacteria bacterium]